MDDKIYYFSHRDGHIHNVNDVEHYIEDNGGNSYACIGRDLGEEGFSVDEEVDLHTIAEIVEIINLSKNGEIETDG